MNNAIFSLQWRHNEQRWRHQSPASWLFAQPFIQEHIKESIKAPPHWPLWGEFTGDRWITNTKGKLCENVSTWWRHHGDRFHNWISLCTSPAYCSPCWSGRQILWTGETFVIAITNCICHLSIANIICLIFVGFEIPLHVITQSQVIMAGFNVTRDQSEASTNEPVYFKRSVSSTPLFDQCNVVW